ncbi:MAG: flagellar biosynthesis repressor FlbT [Rhodospirillales bacterium]
MALVINIKKGQQIIINGAVIENVTGKTVSIAVKNEASILRSSDILTPDSALTPAGRVYYALQCVYLFPDRREDYLRHFKELIGSYGRAAPSSGPIIEAVCASVVEQQYYAALKKAQELIAHEREVLTHAHERLLEDLRCAASAGEPARDGGMGADPGGPEHEGGTGRG